MIVAASGAPKRRKSLPGGTARVGRNPGRERNGPGKFTRHRHEIDPGDGVYLMRELYREIGLAARHQRGIERAPGQDQPRRKRVGDTEMAQHPREMHAADPAAVGIGDHDRGHAEQPIAERLGRAYIGHRGAGAHSHSDLGTGNRDDRAAVDLAEAGQVGQRRRREQRQLERLAGENPLSHLAGFAKTHGEAGSGRFRKARARSPMTAFTPFALNTRMAPPPPETAVRPPSDLRSRKTRNVDRLLGDEFEQRRLSSLVCWMPRRIASLICPGSVTRSP